MSLKIELIRKFYLPLLQFEEKIEIQKRHHELNMTIARKKVRIFYFS